MSHASLDFINREMDQSRAFLAPLPLINRISDSLPASAASLVDILPQLPLLVVCFAMLDIFRILPNQLLVGSARLVYFSH